MREPRPRERLCFFDIVQALDELVSQRTAIPHLASVLDGVEMIADMMDAAAGRPNHIIEPGEIAHEERLGRRTIGIEPAIGHRLPTAGLVARIDDLMAEALEELKGRDADFGKE